MTNTYPSPELVAASDAYDIAIYHYVDAITAGDHAKIARARNDMKNAHDRLDAAFANSKEATP